MYDEPGLVTNLLYDAWYADQTRSDNRALVQDQANGFPPWSDEDANAEGFTTNVNFLEMCALCAAGRRQFNNAYFSPGRYFSVGLDFGPQFKRGDWSAIITNAANGVLKRSLPYMESKRSKFANVILHGIGPSLWQDRYRVAPEPLGIEDVLIPSGTRIVMDNLPWIGVLRQYTAMELTKKTTGPRVDPGWNMKLVKGALDWARDQYLKDDSFIKTFSPEKISEAFKESITAYPLDTVPTIDCWVFLYYDDTGKETGWKQKIVLDTFAGGNAEAFTQGLTGRESFLYESEMTVGQRENNIHFTFGDLSAKAPFMYHSVRSLGWLLYAVCHLQDKLKCRFNDAAFESTLQYFRVNNEEDVDRLQKIDLINKGIVPPGMEFVKAADRWQVNGNLAESAMNMMSEIIAQHSSSYVSDMNIGLEGETRETATKTNQRAQQAAAMVGSMLQLSYEYEKSDYQEVCRRLCIPNSRDAMAREFRLECLKRGVPEAALNSERWDIRVERVIGGGNKAVQLAETEALFQNRFALDPESQRIVVRKWVLARTDDPDLTEELAPMKPLQVTDSVHDAQLAAGTLMMGLPVSVRTGQNHQEYAVALLQALGTLIQSVMTQQGGVAGPDQLKGFQNMASNIGQHIQLLAQEGKANNQLVKQLGDVLGKMMNAVKGMAQRLQQAMKAQAQQGGQPQMDPKDMAKLQFELAHNRLKLQTQDAAAKQRLQQRQQQFMGQKLQQDIEHGQRIRHQLQEHGANLAKTGMEMQQRKMAALEE